MKRNFLITITLLIAVSVMLCNVKLTLANGLLKQQYDELRKGDRLTVFKKFLEISGRQNRGINNRLKAFDETVTDDEFKWMLDTNGAFVLQPVIGDSGNIYGVGSGIDFDSSQVVEGELIVVEPNIGNINWNFKVNSQISGLPVVDGTGTVYLSTLPTTNNKSALSAIADGGKLLWRFETDGNIRNSPLLSDKKLIFGRGDILSNTGKLFSMDLDTIDPENVAPDWVFETEGLIELTPLEDSGLIIVVVLDERSDPDNSTIVAFDKNNITAGGSVIPKWSFSTEGLVLFSPTIKDDRMYFPVLTEDVNDVKVISINLDGQQIWEFKVGGIIIGSPVVDTDGVTYISTTILNEGGTGESKLIAINSDGSKKWEFNEVKNNTLLELILSVPVLDPDGNIFIGTAGVGRDGIVGNIYSINSDNGTQNWVANLAGAVITPPVIGKGDSVYVGLSKVSSFDLETVTFEGLAGSIINLNKVDGTVNNSFETKGAVIAPLSLTDNSLFVGSFNQDGDDISGTLYAVVAEGAPESGIISGVVSDSETGNAVFKADISALKADVEEGAASSEFDGSYLLVDLPIGEYSLKIDAEGFEEGIVENIEVSTGKNVVRNVSLKPVTDTGTIEGKVVDSVNKDGIEGANVSTTEGGFLSVTDSDGDYKLSGLPESVFTVEVSADGFGSQTAELVAVLVRNKTLLDFELTPPAPVAEFSAEPVSGKSPLTVAFTDESTGNITEWLWVLGDGNLSDEQNPNHTYEQAGMFSAILTVTGPGGSNSIIKADLIEAIGPPVADFEAIATAGFLPFAAQFSDLSLGDVTSWSWDFGDGGTSEEQNASHSYENEGLFTVNLEVSGVGGTDSEIKSDYIKTLPIAKPLAAFSANASIGFSPFEVHFNNLSTGDLTNILWDFGDGETSAGQSPVHKYEKEGDYDVTLSVETSGGSDVVTKIGFIKVLPVGEPRVEFSADKTVAFAPLEIQFTDLSQGLRLKSWLWDFGDGAISAERSPVHEYKIEGFYTPTLTVTGSGGTGIERKINLIIAISTGNPRAEFKATPSTFFTPQEVQFTDLSEGVGINSWVWNFGDGGISTEQSPKHTYTVPGNFSVNLTISNENGAARETKLNLINSLQEGFPLSDFSGSPVNGFAPLEVEFSELAEPADEIDSYFWDFGDGAVSSEKNPKHTYSRNGIFTVSLTVSNDQGANSETKNNLINVEAAPAPIADFEADITTGLKPIDIKFTDLSTGAIDSWLWLFGDGSSSEQQNPEHKYARTGMFFVSLTVSGPGGADVETKNNLITVSDVAPVAEFSATPTVVTKRTEIQFTDLSEGGVNGWLWDFGDGKTSIDQNPKHAYSRIGDYTVSLTASGTGGTDAETKTNFITVKRKRRREPK